MRNEHVTKNDLCLIGKTHRYYYYYTLFILEKYKYDTDDTNDIKLKTIYKNLY